MADKLKEATAAGAASGTGTGIVALTSIFLLGFSKLGVAKASAAASIQSGIGNVAAGNLFAKMTSIGMTGVLPFAITAGTVIGLAVGSVALATKFIGKNS